MYISDKSSHVWPEIKPWALHVQDKQSMSLNWAIPNGNAAVQKLASN